MSLKIKNETFGYEDQSWLGSAHGTQAGDPITLDLSAFTAADHYPAGFLKSGIVLGRITATGLYGPYLASPSEVQRITVDATGGTFTVTFDGATTAAISATATAAAVQTALELLATINAGDVTVTGGPGSAGGGTPYILTFGGRYLGINVPAVTTAAGSLTGGAGTAAVTTTTAGAGTGSDGSETAAGILLCSVPVSTTDNTDDPGGSLYWHGEVIETNLPDSGAMTNGGIDAAGKADLKHIRFV